MDGQTLGHAAGRGTRQQACRGLFLVHRRRYPASARYPPSPDEPGRNEVSGHGLPDGAVRDKIPAEKLLIPAFLYFFLKLYPPKWVANAKSRTAGAAGGCVLLRREALNRIGGLAGIRGEVIDD